LDAEAERNLELIWLTGRLAPDFKTVADFRRDNGEAIRQVCKEFVLLCRRIKLFADCIVAIDGSKFKAVNNRDRRFTDYKLQARGELDRADRDATAVLPGRVAHLKDKIAKVKLQMHTLWAFGEQMKASEDGHTAGRSGVELTLGGGQDEASPLTWCRGITRERPGRTTSER